MTPYGIVYKDNPYFYEQSVSIWQKKFGVMKLSLLIKISLIINLLLGIIYLAAGYILKEPSYALFYAFHFVATVFSVYTVMRNTNIKGLASQCMQKTDLQIVFYDDRFILTAPYSKSEYYYDEIIYCEEKNGGITIIIDEGVAPVSVYSGSIKVGSYGSVRNILSDRLCGRFITAGEGRI